jgi:hypothetical protein
MTRALVAAVLAGVALVPVFSRAADIPDAVDCSQTGLGALPVMITRGDPDRFAVCVTDGTSSNGAELYLGGEFDPERPVAGPCSAFVIAGRTIAGDPDWLRVDKGDPFDDADDVPHDCE